MKYISALLLTLFSLATSAATRPESVLTGFATLNGGTTGGQGGASVTAATRESVQSYLRHSNPMVIQIHGTIPLGDAKLRVGSNKTLAGVGHDATLIGGVVLQGSTNVILRNLTFTNPRGGGHGDGLTIIDFSQNIWVDHCDFYDGQDGNLDITRGSDLITVSWCRFFYRNQTEHALSNLIGASDNHGETDEERLRVTLHHNWWGEGVRSRMPRARFGEIHAFNNYFHAPGNRYCVRAAVGAEVLLEENHFENVRNPWEVYVTSGATGKIRARDNLEVDTTRKGNDKTVLVPPGNDAVFEPPYEYQACPANQVADLVKRYAGVQRKP